MMESHTRYASHFLLLPGYGYLKQMAVELAGGRVKRIFPLMHECEDTVWLPGLIALPDVDEWYLMSEEPCTVQLLFQVPLLPWSGDLPSPVASTLIHRMACHVTPFDLTLLQPVDGTRHRLLP